MWMIPLFPSRKRRFLTIYSVGVDSLRLDLPIWLVSNNLSENRIGAIADNLQLPYLLGAVKPSRRKLRQAMAAMSLPPTNCYGWRSLVYRFLAGNRLGMFTILVKPMVNPLTGGQLIQSTILRCGYHKFSAFPSIRSIT